jgi:osmotically-inducible protein OsmY
MDSHGKLFYVPALCLVMLALVTSSSVVGPIHIAVTTTQGVVTLKGRVNKGDARDKAERYARETDGVQRVIDLVKVGDSR